MKRWIVSAVVALGVGSGAGYGQAKAKAPVMASASAAVSADQMAETQGELIKLLRVSPVLTEVIERDPSLLTDQAYVNRMNPQLADFLAVHPEVVRNPDYFLFNGIEDGHGRRRWDLLQHRVWPEMVHREEGTFPQMVQQTIVPFLVFLCVLGALIWLLKMFVENRRWSRAIKLQVDAHSRLVERFSTNQELMAYVESEVGRKFLESGPSPVDFGQTPRIPSAVARVLTPLQIGVVMTLLGAGFLMLRHSVYQARVPFLIAGVVVLMPGLGFILSAGLTWLLAGRLGMIPDASSTTTRDRM